jgi:TPR repeat protein
MSISMCNLIARLLISSALIGALPAVAAESAYNLGVQAYRAKDYAGAREQWSLAAREGETSALNNLGYLLYQGLGGGTDQAGAVVLWRHAAMRGHAEAQWHLGAAFEQGAGVDASLLEAYAWYRCALANNDTSADADAAQEIARDAGKSLSALMARLPTEQFSAAEQRAREYIEKYARAAAAN